MKRSQLNELIRLITRQILKEYTVNQTSMLAPPAPTKSDKDKEEDDTSAMSAAEKASYERSKEHMRDVQMKEKRAKLDAVKKKLEFQKKEMDHTRRFDIPQINKDIQRLQGAQI